MLASVRIRASLTALGSFANVTGFVDLVRDFDRFWSRILGTTLDTVSDYADPPP